MAHSLTPVPASPSTPIATLNKNKILPRQRVLVCHCHHQNPNHNNVLDDHQLLHRRTVTLSLAGAMLGLNLGDRSAFAAARRPPPPPPSEKKDPNVSGLQAKIRASKKRKEELKQAVAKLREKGKSADGPSPPPIPPQ